jgi:hypothetical protein
MNNSYQVGDLIKVYGDIISLHSSPYPAPQGSMVAIDISGENIVLEGQVVSISENGQVRTFRITSETSNLVGRILDVNSFDNLQIEYLKNG